MHVNLIQWSVYVYVINIKAIQQVNLIKLKSDAAQHESESCTSKLLYKLYI